MSEVTEQNKRVYDKSAVSRFDQEIWQNLADFLVEIIVRYDVDAGVTENDLNLDCDRKTWKAQLENIPVLDKWKTKSLELMDFACGAGNITKYIEKYAGNIVGVDLSQDMVSAYQDRTRFKAYSVDFCNPDDANAASIPNNFDVIVCTMSYHHIENYALVTRKLGEKLRKGGWLIVIDMDGTNSKSTFDQVIRGIRSGAHNTHHHSHNPHSHSHQDSQETQELAEKFGIAHKHGLSPAGIRETFEDAGLTNVSVGKNFNLTAKLSKDEFSMLSKAPLSQPFEQVPPLTFSFLLAAGQKQ